jgi:hypothetical protein
MLNGSGDSGHPCLVPDFRGNVFSFSPLSMMWAAGLCFFFYKIREQEGRTGSARRWAGSKGGWDGEGEGRGGTNNVYTCK